MTYTNETGRIWTVHKYFLHIFLFYNLELKWNLLGLYLMNPHMNEEYM